MGDVTQIESVYEREMCQAKPLRPLLNLFMDSYGKTIEEMRKETENEDEVVSSGEKDSKWDIMFFGDDVKLHTDKWGCMQKVFDE